MQKREKNYNAKSADFIKIRAFIKSEISDLKFEAYKFSVLETCSFAF